MSPRAHTLYISVLAAIVVFSFAALTWLGLSYYGISLENRFFHEQHGVLKPSGTLGHGFGIVGSAMIIIGISSYMLRKRWRKLSRLGLLKHWLEFHIFLCILGPILVLFHTSMKFGGIVAISFWSMVAVVLSGFIGRFIYIQIPRTMEGRELSLGEISLMKSKLTESAANQAGTESPVAILLRDAFINRPDTSQKNLVSKLFIGYKYDNAANRRIIRLLKKEKLSRAELKKARKLLKVEIRLYRRIDMLESMRKTLEYWHVIHLPFALAMLIVMIIHVVVVLTLGYKWIF